MKKISLLIFILLLSSSSLMAKINLTEFEKKLSYRIIAGFNIGATAPRSMPNTIRKISYYSPRFSPSLGYFAMYPLHEKWILTAGLQIDFKGMKVTDSVAYFHTLLQSGNGQSGFEGSFTGTNSTLVNNVYLTIPIYTTYRLTSHWSLEAGGYMAYLLSPKFEGHVSDGYIRNGGDLGEKVIIDHAEFDFSDKLRRMDYGLHGGVAYQLGARWAAALQMNWGLCRIFPSSFSGVDIPLYNLYGKLGLGYNL